MKVSEYCIIYLPHTKIKRSCDTSIYYIYIYIISRSSITPQRIKYSSKSLDVFMYIYIYVYVFMYYVYNLYISAASCLRQERTNKANK